MLLQERGQKLAKSGQKAVGIQAYANMVTQHLISNHP